MLFQITAIPIDYDINDNLDTFFETASIYGSYDDIEPYEGIIDIGSVESISDYFAERSLQILESVKTNDNINKDYSYYSVSGSSGDLLIAILFLDKDNIFIYHTMDDKERENTRLLSMLYSGSAKRFNNILDNLDVGLTDLMAGKCAPPRSGKYGYEEQHSLLYNIKKFCQPLSDLPKEVSDNVVEGIIKGEGIINFDDPEVSTCLLNKNGIIPTSYERYEFVVLNLENDVETQVIVFDKDEHDSIVRIYRLDAQEDMELYSLGVAPYLIDGIVEVTKEILY